MDTDFEHIEEAAHDGDDGNDHRGAQADRRRSDKRSDLADQIFQDEQKLIHRGRECSRKWANA